MTLTAEQLRAELDYDPATGTFTRRRLGGRVGKTMTDGYHRINVCGKAYYAHKLAWLHVHGVLPDMEIVHADGVRTNNAIANLRCVPRWRNGRPDKESVLAQLRVDAQAGVAHWIGDPSRHPHDDGAPAGRLHLQTDGSPYWLIVIDGCRVMRSHIVWLAVHGAWPERSLRRVNGDGLDDRIENLREWRKGPPPPKKRDSSKLRSAKARTNGMPTGVHKTKSRRRPFVAQIYVNGKRRYLGVFRTAEEASAAYQAALRLALELEA